MRLPRLTISRAMIVVSVLGVSLAAFRYHISVGSSVSCVLVLAIGRAFSIIDRLRREGRPLTGLGAAVIYASCWPSPRRSSSSRCSPASSSRRCSPVSSHSPPYDPFATFVGVVASVVACVLARRRLWPFSPGVRRHP
jgi:hypothetical protein